MNALCDHWFASGQHDILCRKLFDFSHDLIDAHFHTFRRPRRVLGIAPTTAEIATRGADKGGRNTREFTLPLDGIKNFGDKHWVTKRQRASAEEHLPPHTWWGRRSQPA